MPQKEEIGDWLRCGSVELHGLTVKEYNGQLGSVLGPLSAGRYTVRLNSGKEIRVKSENVRQYAVSLGVHLGSAACHLGWLNGSGFTPLVSMETFIAFTASKRLFGAAARRQHANNAANSIPGYILLSMLGKTCTGFSRTSWAGAAKKIGLTIQTEEKFESRTPTVQVTYRREIKHFGAEELLAMLLMELKRRAELALKGLRVADIVLSVPTSFGDGARKAVRDAVLVSGLKLARVTTHTSAQLMSRLMPRLLRGTKPEDDSKALTKDGSDIDSEDDEKQGSEERTLLMVHAGELETDVVMASVEQGIVDVRGVGHMEGALGFSSQLLRHCKGILGQDNKHEVPEYVELLTKCGEAHARFGDADEVELEFDQGLDMSTVKITFQEWLDLTRAKQRVMTLLNEVRAVVPDLIISEVFVGGAHARLLSRVLRESCPYKCSLMPTDASTRGAALMSTILTGGPMADLLLIDVTSSSVGLETAGGIMSHIIAKNCTIPCKKNQIFSTYTDNQDKILVQLYEGENNMSKDNQLLSTYAFGGYVSAARGVPQLDITFEVDTNGCCQVTGKEIRAGGNTQLAMSETKENRLSRAQIDTMRQFHMEYLHGDQERENCLWELVRGGHIGQKQFFAASAANSPSIPSASASNVNSTSSTLDTQISAPRASESDSKTVYSRRPSSLQSLSSIPEDTIVATSSAQSAPAISALHDPIDPSVSHTLPDISNRPRGPSSPPPPPVTPSPPEASADLSSSLTALTDAPNPTPDALSTSNSPKADDVLSTIDAARSVRTPSLPPPPPRKTSCATDQATETSDATGPNLERRMSRIAPPPPQKAVTNQQSSLPDSQPPRRISAPPPPRKSVILSHAPAPTSEISPPVNQHPLAMFFSHPLCDARKLLMDIGDYL